MKKYIISLLMTVMAMTASAQSIGEAFYIYRNDGGFNAFFREEVDSIVYSNYDNDSIYYDDVVSQVIYTTDSIYRIPLAAIDSVAFGVNELRISDSYIRMPEEDYVVEEADTLAQNYLLRFMSTVPDLSEGNIISVVNDTLVAQVRIDQLSWLDGNKVRIKGEKANLEDIFIEGSFTLSTGQAPNNSISHPHIYYPVEIRYSDSDGTSRRFIRHDDTEFTHSLYSQSIDYSGTDIHKTDHTRLYLETCRFDFNLDLVMKCNFSSATEAGDKYSHGELALQKSVIRGTVDTDFMLRFDASGQKKFDGEETMLKRNLHKPFGAKFIVAGVPVYVEMTTHLLMDASYDIEGEFSAYSGYATNNTAELGFSWSQATGLRPYSRYNTSFTFHKPTIEGKAHLESKITVFPRITFSLYGLVGPSFDIKPYLRPVIDIGFYDQFGSNEADYYGAKCNLFTGYDAAVGLTFLSSLGKQPIVMSKPWNVVNKLLFESPKKIQFKEGSPERLTIGKPMKTTFHVTDYDYLFKKEYDTELPFAVKFTTNSGSLSNDFSLIDITTGDVSITWIPDDNTTDGKDASIVAMMHDHEGNIITTDRWTPQKAQNSDPPVTLEVSNIGDHSIEVIGRLNNAQTNTNRKVGFFFNKTGEPDETNGSRIVGEIYDDDEEDDFLFFKAEIDNMQSKESYYYRAFENVDGEFNYGATKSIKIDFDQMQCPDGNHPHMIDLGLPSGNKWSCCILNQGQDYIPFYRWGETRGINSYEDDGRNKENISTYANGHYEGDHYRWWDEDSYDYYSEIRKNYYCDNLENISGTDKDAAYVEWGNGWRMPTMEDCKELFENCHSIVINDVGDILFIGPNGTVLPWGPVFQTWTSSQCPISQENPHYQHAYIFQLDDVHVRTRNHGIDCDGPFYELYKWYYMSIIPIHK